MTKRDQPLTLRLPFAMVDRHLRMEQILAAAPGRSWAQSFSLLPVFALSTPEKHFVRRLLWRKRNVWLFRCNQRCFCGDFVAVDMSPTSPQLRSVVVVELKHGAGLRFGGAGAGNQLQRAGDAVREVAEREEIVARNSPIRLACGGGDEVLEWIGEGKFAYC